MKSELIEKKEKGIEFPYLMVSIRNGSIYLITEGNGEAFTGICVHSESIEAIGRYSTKLDSSAFEKFEGKVILSNK